MIYILFLLALLCAGVLSLIILRKTELLKIAVYGMAMFFVFYILSAGFLIWFDSFGIEKALVISLISEIIVSVVAWLYGPKRKISISVSPVLTISAVVLASVFVWISGLNKAGLYPAGQDQGLYQFKALLYMSGDYDNINTFEEYNMLTDDREKFIYYKTLHDMVGVWTVNEEVDPVPVWGQEDPEITSDDVDLDAEGVTNYVLHGIAVLPALMALWGKMFGLTHMTGILTVFYVLSILGVMLICNNLGMKKYSCIAASVIQGICPIVLWSSFVTLPEICLAMLMTLFFCLLTENRKRDALVWSALPLAAFGFYHVLMLTMLPLFMFIYFIIYLYSKKKSSLIAMGVTILFYGLGLNMMNSYNEPYVQGNIWSIVRITKFLVNYDNYMAVLVGVPAALFVVLLIVCAILKYTRTLRKINRFLKKSSRAKVIMFTIISVLLVAGITVFAIIVYNNSVVGRDVVPSRFTVFGVESMTGYILLPAAVIYMIVFIKGYAKDYRKIAIITAMLYIISVYAIAMIPNIYYYYYYFRYFGPYMMLIIIPGMMLLEKGGPFVVVPAGGVMAWLIVSQSIMLYTERDMTYADFDVLESIASCVGERDVVLLKDDEFTVTDMYMIPIKAVTGATVMLYDDEKIDDQLETLGGMYDNIFYFAYDYGHGDDEESGWRHVYQEMFHCAGFNGFTDEYPPYPQTSIAWDASVGLYIYTGKGY